MTHKVRNLAMYGALAVSAVAGLTAGFNYATKKGTELTAMHNGSLQAVAHVSPLDRLVLGHPDLQNFASKLTGPRNDCPATEFVYKAISKKNIVVLQEYIQGNTSHVIFGRVEYPPNVIEVEIDHHQNNGVECDPEVFLTLARDPKTRIKTTPREFPKTLDKIFTH